MSTPPFPDDAGFHLGSRVRDKITHIAGVLLCIQHWHDRADDAAIQREGLNADGNAFDLHWCPLSRVEPVR